MDRAMKGMGWLLAAVVVVAGCTTAVPPTVTWGPQGSFEKSPLVYVVAARERERVISSLATAGLTPIENASKAHYTLQVDLGNSRRTDGCGSVHNVRYILTSGAARMLVLKGRGHTGGCVPNILDDMSSLVASYF